MPEITKQEIEAERDELKKRVEELEALADIHENWFSAISEQTLRLLAALKNGRSKLDNRLLEVEPISTLMNGPIDFLETLAKGTKELADSLQKRPR